MTYLERIKALLTEYGPLSADELALELGITPLLMQGKLGQLRHRHPGQIRIAAWRRDEVRGYLYPRAIYGVGSEPDAKRPKPLTNAQYNARYRRVAHRRVNSVWSLAIPVVERHRRQA